MEEKSLILLTGVSGSGKSTALNTLEDLGFFCVENLPAALVMPFAEELLNDTKFGEELHRYALLVDCRHESSFPVIEKACHLLRDKGIRTEIVFLECSDEVVIKRFKETRRKHPLFGKGSYVQTIAQALQKERELLKEFRNAATIVIDTTQTSVHELRRLIEDFCELRKDMLISVQSFGYKYGIPVDVDLLFDVRFLPNPFFEKDLKPLTGLNTEVRDFVLGQRDAVEFLEHLERLLGFLIPQYEREGKQYLNIGIGCTGGMHRSVALSEEIALRLRASEKEVKIHHRDMQRKISN